MVGIGNHPELITISVRQILQAEKTIRIRFLIDSGFKMSDLQDIFVNINKGSNADSEVVCALLEHLQGYHFTASLDIPKNDQAVILRCMYNQSLKNFLLRRIVRDTMTF